MQFGIKLNGLQNETEQKTKINICLLKLQEGFLLVVKLTKLCVCVSLFTHSIFTTYNVVAIRLIFPVCDVGGANEY